MARILVIEDDDELRSTLKKVLETEGHEVVEACNGNEGIKLYRENPADAVVTDIMMPGESGIAVIEKLKRDYPDIKIIAISGVSPSDKQNMLRMSKILGAEKILSKPFGRQEILGFVNELLSEKT